MSAKLFYRLIDAAAEKVYRTATVLGPAVGGAVIAGMANAGSKLGTDDQYGSDFPDISDVTHLNWEATYGNHRTDR
jgi:hypothetical protein